MSVQPPEKLTFHTRAGEVYFDVWGIAYDKGANSGITIQTEQLHTIENGFDSDISIKIKLKETFYGMTYKDLKDLSKWANVAAKWVKYMESKGKYSSSFNENASVNDEHNETTKLLKGLE